MEQRRHVHAPALVCSAPPDRSPRSTLPLCGGLPTAGPPLSSSPSSLSSPLPPSSAPAPVGGTYPDAHLAAKVLDDGILKRSISIGAH